MTLKVVQGLVGASQKLPPPPDNQTAIAPKPAESPAASIQGVIAAASSITVASEAVVTTIRSTIRPQQVAELRSPDDAEKLARKVARDIKETKEGDFGTDAIEAHSGLDVVSRSGRGSGDLLL